MGALSFCFGFNNVTQMSELYLPHSNAGIGLCALLVFVCVCYFLGSNNCPCVGCVELCVCFPVLQRATLCGSEKSFCFISACYWITLLFG